MTYRKDLIASLIRDVPDFPEPGLTFKDITPLLANPNGYAAAISELVDTASRDVDVVLGMEARGFMFAGPVALSLGENDVSVVHQPVHRGSGQVLWHQLVEACRMDV